MSQVGSELSEEEKNIILRNYVQYISNETARSRLRTEWAKAKTVRLIEEARMAREAASAAIVEAEEKAAKAEEEARLAAEAEAWERQLNEATAAAEAEARERQLNEAVEALNDEDSISIEYMGTLAKELTNKDNRVVSLIGGSKRKKKSKKNKSYKKKKNTKKNKKKQTKKVNKKSKQKKIVVKKLKI